MLDVEKIKEKYVILLTEAGCRELKTQDDVLVDLVCTAAALGFGKGFVVGRGVKE